MRNDHRKQLLADYAVALVAERELWERLQQPQLTESERCRTVGEWKHIAATLKTLVRQLRDAPAAPVFQPPCSARPAGEAIVVPHPEAAPAAAQAPAAVGADAVRLRFPVPSLVATLRLVSWWRARLGAALPSLGSL